MAALSAGAARLFRIELLVDARYRVLAVVGDVPDRLVQLGADNILFAVDWPYEPNTAGMEFLRKLSISDADREKIAHRNAERILRM